MRSSPRFCSKATQHTRPTEVPQQQRLQQIFPFFLTRVARQYGNGMEWHGITSHRRGRERLGLRRDAVAPPKPPGLAKKMWKTRTEHRDERYYYGTTVQDRSIDTIPGQSSARIPKRAVWALVLHVAGLPTGNGRPVQTDCWSS
jgi:hypothetical protein